MNAEINAPIGQASEKGISVLFLASTCVIIRAMHSIASHLLHRRVYEICRIVECGQHCHFSSSFFLSFFFIYGRDQKVAVVKTEI